MFKKLRKKRKLIRYLEAEIDLYLRAMSGGVEIPLKTFQAAVREIKTLQRAIKRLKKL